MNGERAVEAELAQTVDGIAGNVHYSAADLGACGHRNRGIKAYSLESPFQSIRRIQGNAANGVFTNVLLHLYNQCLAVRFNDLKSIVYLGKSLLPAFFRQGKMNVHNRADNLRNEPCHIP